MRVKSRMEFIRVQVYSFKSTITRINPLIQWIPLLTSQSGTALFLKKSDAWIKHRFGLVGEKICIYFKLILSGSKFQSSNQGSMDLQRNRLLIRECRQAYIDSMETILNRFASKPSGSHLA